MYYYDTIAMIVIGLNHFLLYLSFIRYNRLSLPIIVTMSLLFTVILGTIITVTGYPEFNGILMVVFLLSLGLLQIELTFWENLYFTLASIVTISLLKIVFFEISSALYLLLPFNLYVWTDNVIHMVVTIIILLLIVLLRKQIQLFAAYITKSPLYYVSYVVFTISFVILFLLTIPQVSFLFSIYKTYGKFLYMSTFILFFIILLIVIIGFHLKKEALVRKQQIYLDNELLQYVKKLELLHDELANFRHDYINLLLTLDQSIRTKNIDQIERTYYDIIAPTKEIINHEELEIIKLANIKKNEIKSLLSVKVFDAQQNNVNVTVDIPHKITSIPMPIVNFIRIISILVDNGIEAAVVSKEKLLTIAFFETKSDVYFIVRNSAEDKEIDFRKLYDKHYSKKDNNRGYGLYSLKRLIDETENASLETSYERPFFTQIVKLKRANGNNDQF